MLGMLIAVNVVISKSFRDISETKIIIWKIAVNFKQNFRKSTKLRINKRFVLKEFKLNAFYFSETHKTNK